MNTIQKPIADLDNLPKEKREQLHAWLTEFGYHKVMEKIRSEWQVEITYNKLYRYRQRVLQLHAFDGIAEDRMTITNFLALQNGDPVPYDEAGIALIQKRAFELACEPKTTPARLNSLLRICHYKKQLEFTERRIDISDRAVKVREAQLADRRAAAAQKAAQSTSEDKPASPTTAPSILVPPNAPPPARTAKLGDHTIDLDALSERARKHFNVPEDEWKARRARSREAREKRLQAEKEQAEREQAEKEKSDQTASNTQPEEAQPANTDESAPIATSNNPQIQQSNNPPVAVSLEDRVNQYTLDRYEEARIGKDRTKVGKYAAWDFKSKMRWCPCGKHLPCPDHGNFPESFWEASSDHSDYMYWFEKKGLPYTSPHVLHDRLREQRERQEQLEKASQPITDSLTRSLTDSSVATNE